MANAKLVACILFALLLTPLSVFSQEQSVLGAPADDWPMFRHDPANTGYSSVASAASPVSLWNYSNVYLPSAAAIADGYFCFIGYDGKLTALNAETGKIKWMNNCTVTYPQYPCPAIANGIVYTTSDAFNLSTGQLLFNYTYCEGSTSPIVSNGTIFLGTSTANFFRAGGVVAINASTTEKLWNFTGEEGKLMCGGMVHFPPAVADGVVYFSCGGGLYALDSQSGQVLWRNSSIDPGSGSLGMVFVANSQVYDSIGGTVNCFGSPSWFAKGGSQAFPVICNGTIYTGRSAIDAVTGEIRWNNNFTDISYPVMAGGVIYCSHFRFTLEGSRGNYNQQELFGFNASTGQLVWNYTLPEPNMFAKPGYLSIANGVLYALEPTGIYAFNLTAATKPSLTEKSGAWLTTLAIVTLAIAIIAAATIIALYKKKASKLM